VQGHHVDSKSCHPDVRTMSNTSDAPKAKRRVRTSNRFRRRSAQSRTPTGGDRRSTRRPSPGRGRRRHRRRLRRPRRARGGSRRGQPSRARLRWEHHGHGGTPSGPAPHWAVNCEYRTTMSQPARAGTTARWAYTLCSSGREWNSGGASAQSFFGRRRHVGLDQARRCRPPCASRAASPVAPLTVPPRAT
jgi:hypothetical protein